MVEQQSKVVNRMTGPTALRRPAAVTAALTPKEVYSILRRHIWLIIILTIIGLIIAGIAWFLLKRYLPKYTAETYIRVLSPVVTPPLTIETTRANKDIEYGYRVTIANLLKQQSTLQELIDRDDVQETKWFRRFAKPWYKRWFTRVDDKEEIKNKAQCILRAFKDLKKHLSAYPHRDAEFIVLKMTCLDAEEAADIVNEMAKLFIDSYGSTKKNEVSNKLAELTKREISVRGELAAAEKAMAQVSEISKITDLERPYGRAYQHVDELKLNQLELEQNNLNLLIKQAEADIKNLERLATEPVNVQVERQVEVDPVMIVLAQQLAFLESELAGQRAKFGDNHKAVLRTQEQVEKIKNERQVRQSEIAEQVRQANLKNAKDQLIVLQGRNKELSLLREEAQARKKDLDLARVQYAQRVAVRDERKQMLDEIKATIENYKIMARDPETPKVQMVGLAQKPLEVSSPRWEFYFPGGLILGLIFGIGLAFALELLNDLVRTPRDVARFLRIPLLSVVPDAAEDEQARDIEPCHIVRKAPYSIVSESYRRCRTNIKLSGSDGSMRTLLVSSGAAGEGKTAVAVNLAASFVAENKKVLLIDANFRRPGLEKIFTMPKAEDEQIKQSEFGLSSLLMGLCSYEDAKRSNVIEGLDIIFSGPLPSNPTELLGSYRMEQLIKDRRQNYDYIIVDGPPVLLVSDAKVLAKIVDGTVLVFNAASTRRGAAQRTIRELIAADATIAGCVLFAVRALKGGYFREQFRSYREYQKLHLAHST
ncbi:MAG: polysaccharide biosynthesis tyrosine autokinase [Phycisphaerae bacterium]|nr:polysaccharide biosynthesis tyrosine autokinase [Phycisphaerae bacterium]NIP55141.1 polysaccharide biosynthesis tyrosine autokinase [Phycisphaerae bacterium]NIS53831.1 polysaccharide biosynthesis tyrosine autokinase [Phycisphaerae bacterium]NIU11427.1 polysaccharide biosynthesis tyrosine autokinase [Phycisphaerae bacterium]NIU59669.1 polysaccharide biosynthesis tyrosine autokinase [Phycisphaerae bacterium]